LTKSAGKVNLHQNAKIMNEETTKIISQLAGKLGTTTEYLWGILLRQAPITASLELLFDVLIVFVLFISWILAKDTKFNDWKCAIYVSLAFANVIIGLIIICTLPTTLAGFLNPEYWALRQLL